MKQSCVVAHTDRTGNQRLAAYFVATPGIESTARSLGEFFVAKMPAHMRPSSYTALKELPLTVNGKLDVAALPTPSVGSGNATRTDSASQSLSETEGQVSRVFTDVLDLQGIGLDDNFFDSGGTSLLLISVHLRLQAHFERLIPVTLMLEFRRCGRSQSGFRAMDRRLLREMQFSSRHRKPGALSRVLGQRRVWRHEGPIGPRDTRERGECRRRADVGFSRHHWHVGRFQGTSDLEAFSRDIAGGRLCLVRCGRTGGEKQCGTRERPGLCGRARSARRSRNIRC